MIPANEAGGEINKAAMCIVSFLTPDSESSEAVVPGVGPLDLPAIAAKAIPGLDAFPRDPRRDASDAQELPAEVVVIALVGVDLPRLLPGPAALSLQGRNEVDRVFQQLAVGDIGAGLDHAEGNTVPGFHRYAALRALLAPVRRVRPNRLAPFFVACGAGTLWVSTATRDQSISPAWCNLVKSKWCILRQTPRACQSRSRLQQVMPEPQPISWGSISQGMPLFRTKMMPVRHARAGTRGRPPLGRSGSRGIIRFTSFHNSSDTNSFAIPI